MHNLTPCVPRHSQLHGEPQVAVLAVEGLEMLRVGLAYLHCDPVPSGELPRIYVVWSADTLVI